MSLRPNPLNKARWLRDVVAGAASYTESINPLHIKSQLWFNRLLADRPMDAANYGSASPFKRADGAMHAITHEFSFAGVGEGATLLSAQPDANQVSIADSTGGGTTVVAERVVDPAGSGRMVWSMGWDCTKLWGNGASSATETSRRRAEFRGPTVGAELIPYDTEIWCITSLRLDSAVDWAGMGDGDYVHWFQMHDTAEGGYNKPAVAGYICAPNSTRDGDSPNPPSNWFLSHELLDENEGILARWFLEKPPVNRWLYQVMQLRAGGSSPFFKLWHADEISAPRLVIDYAGAWGFPDLGTEYFKCGPYSPGQYKGAVPVRRYWQDGFVQLRAEDVPGMTPERMVAALIEQPRY